jgi:LPXTG-site transpeptidase (sortase) family protein
MRKVRFLTLAIILFMVLTLLGPSFGVSAAGTSPTVNVAGSFSVITYSTVTNVPTSSISGSVGVHPGSADPGLTAAQVGGTIYLADAQALAAKSDAQAAFTNLNGQGCDTPYVGIKDLAGLSLVPGVYCAGAFRLTGVLNLSGSSGVWIFRSAADIVTSPGSSVTGGDPCNTWWTAVSSVTLDTTTHFIGTVIASDSITMNTGATLNGRAWALNGQVSLQSNTINGPICTAGTPTSTTTASGPVTLGGNITDTAHLVGGSGTLSGAITFDVFAPGDTTCATPLTALTPVTVTGGGDYTSGNFATVTLGSYRWKAHYSGDPNNTNVNTACNDPNETSLVTAASTILPVTGFAPQHVTVLSAQPAEKAYADLGDLWLEIPRLGVQMPIVGVPQSVDGTWDVSWLGNDAGWLQGSAFPTWTGNSVLTGHVYNADGKPGPFVYLNQMWWDDKIIVHAGGAQYIYTVRTVTQVSPNDTAAMMKHQTIPWITLVTCRGYDQSSNSYKYRVLVRAVLVDVK